MEYTLEIMNMELLCRICLSDAEKLHSLNSQISSHKINISDALEVLVSEKVIIAEHCPSKICELCLDNVIKAYTLREKFLNSKKVLQNLLGDLYDQKLEDSVPVEIIVGKSKYNLKDVVIIDNVKEEKPNFNGFLKNLGKSVTASFVNDQTRKEKVKMDEPDLSKKIDNVSNLEEIETDDEKPEKLLDINLDDYINDLNKPTNEEQFILNLDTINTNKNFVMDQDLLESALNKHLECMNCHKVYSNKTRYKNHLLICPKSKSKDRKITYPCKLCKKIFKNLNTLKLHVKDVHSSSPLPKTCEICNTSFNNRQNYINHKKYAHSDKAYICDYCGKKLSNKNSLQDHIQRHDSKNSTVQCICPICGKTFNYKGGLFYHLKIHNGEKKHVCKYCSRKFFSRISLSRHEKTHTGVRPFECELCKKRFFSNGELGKHIFTHTGISSYRCQFCNKYFSSKFNLDVHLTFYSGEHKCEICNRGFISKAIVRFHKMRKHKNKEKSNTEDDLKVEDSKLFEFEVEYIDVEEDNVIIENYEVV